MREFLQKLQFNLPAILTTLLILKVILFSTSIADALAILALCGLYGYKMFLNYQIKPDPNAELKEEIDKIRGEISNVSVAVSQRKPQSQPTPFRF